MRFSLLTLLLVKLWIGLAVLVWLRRDVWVALPADEKAVSLFTVTEDMLRFQSPDGSRFIQSYDKKVLDHYVETKEAVIWDSKTRRPLYAWRGLGLPHEESLSKLPIHFADDDHLIVQYGNLNFSVQVVLQRRYPEWWWGHFYRAEVWGLIVLSGVLVWRLRRRATVL